MNLFKKQQQFNQVKNNVMYRTEETIGGIIIVIKFNQVNY